MGAMARHGPHHEAQKSTSTGWSDFRTSWSKFASFTSRIASLAIIPPFEPLVLQTYRRHCYEPNYYPSTCIRCSTSLEVASPPGGHFARRCGVGSGLPQQKERPKPFSLG